MSKTPSTICFRATVKERMALERLAMLYHRTVSDQIRAMIAQAARAERERVK